MQLSNIAHGPEIRDEAVAFCLWAPLHQRVTLKIEKRGQWQMKRLADGWHRVEIPGARPGDLYTFILPNGLEVPDPASRFQPNDVHGPSEIIDPTFAWRTEPWNGRPWEEMVIYEMHLGAFTEAGTFLAAIEKLEHLRRLGITAIQLMPLSDFPGRYGWGYDGVLSYAPDSSYGRPEDLRSLVDAAHGCGISVFLDVVYNHFGPDGNYLPHYAPIFSDTHKTPWGRGLNFDGAGSRFVRDFIIENAIYWIREFRMDGLRLDAVHAIRDDSHPHILCELAERVREAVSERPIHLIAENEDNNADLLARDAQGRARQFTAQWNDDIHHVLHIAATGETFGYYRDYAGDGAKIGRALAEGFVFQGEHMPYRGKTRGRPSTGLPPTAFVSFIQNHDQIGNRAMGDRMNASHPIEAIKAIAAIYLLAPQIPMLFMGEEWGSTDPFPFFCDLADELNETIRAGRKEELSRLPGFDVNDALDPICESTFRQAKLQWRGAIHNEPFVEYYRLLLSLRRKWIVPCLADARGHSAKYDSDGRLVCVTWKMGRSILHLMANLSGEAVDTTVPNRKDIILSQGDIAPDRLGPWAVLWSLAQE
ncbi:malto-oligosyltrehalose trehalohydrolase [Rhizobium sp. RCC_161_2]|uniref:malto-oligosyltrehalose trehalohydrolase n=1 Tax=Rhizobium sp. RCC_161_2 TaxID=3239219 RepID=UPI003525B679